MKSILTHFKPYDYILIAIAVGLSFLPLIITSRLYSNHSNSELVAIVKISGKVVDELSLNSPKEVIKTYHPNDKQYNTIEIKNGQIRVKEDNSPDQIAVRTGWISQEGQILVCLPHQFLIEITRKGQTDEAVDDLILPL